MTSKISVFLPTRKGSERVDKKNTRSFAGVDGGLLAIKLQQLFTMDEIDEVVLSTNDPESILVAEGVGDARLRVVLRPEELAQSSTNLVDLVRYVPTICDNEHILWTHVTSPFTSAPQYSKAIKAYFRALSRDYDSLMSGKPYKNFLWSLVDKDIVNRATSEKWPRTQDLNNWYEIDSAIFLASRHIYIQEDDRIGRNPYLFEQQSIQSHDVDYEEDFIMAEMLYRMLKN